MKVHTKALRYPGEPRGAQWRAQKSAHSATQEHLVVQKEKRGATRGHSCGERKSRASSHLRAKRFGAIAEAKTGCSIVCLSVVFEVTCLLWNHFFFTQRQRRDGPQCRERKESPRGTDSCRRRQRTSASTRTNLLLASSLWMSQKSLPKTIVTTQCVAVSHESTRFVSCATFDLPKLHIETAHEHMQT